MARAGLQRHLHLNRLTSVGRVVAPPGARPKTPTGTGGERRRRRDARGDLASGRTHALGEPADSFGELRRREGAERKTEEPFARTVGEEGEAVCQVQLTRGRRGTD